MKITVKRSGNSATLRIPADVLNTLDISIGEELSMNINENGFSFEKIYTARQGWFDNICPMTAKKEAVIMEKDFADIQNTHLVDEWDFGEEW